MKSATKSQVIVLGGGCFWCTEAVFSRIEGVLKVEPGYAGGTTKNPTYEEVCTGRTGHAEVVRIEYDSPETLPRILDAFFATHDPTSLNRQGNDVGTQYRSAVFYKTNEQKLIVEKAIKHLQQSLDKPIVTEIKQLHEFYPAEDYHKNYFKKNPLNPYCMFVIRPKLKKLEQLGL
ncbi:MAG: peptide-methionine (S)-S-oxide reductase MsrA [Candidatus Woesearchaeota archaeon]